eukprot:GDKI01010300.1.p1 GENE.GDKI01010300.1~~GDKI01010300.1.p1  ORF type:complete len:122 (+),score=4.61 GDKI01010300.1:167-532(+)
MGTHPPPAHVYETRKLISTPHAACMTHTQTSIHTPKADNRTCIHFLFGSDATKNHAHACVHVSLAVNQCMHAQTQPAQLARQLPQRIRWKATTITNRALRTRHAYTMVQSCVTRTQLHELK